ncbi:MAG: hypothetical protein ABJF10_03905 [Chthoniobacter sp.]|uniref:O-antigen ligase family protein n=1 Tax=Chthoniobacter sp. TaxID=2510640 RepID=UPI0032AD7E21
MNAVFAPRSRPMFAPRDERYAQILVFSGWAIALLYFPSGLLHYYLGGKVYARDALMGLHFMACVWFFYRTGLFGRWMRQCWWLAWGPLLVLPSVIDMANAVEAFTVWKWTVLWSDWIMLGTLAVLTWLEPRGVVILGSLTLLLLTVDGIAGFHEYQTNRYVFSIKSGEKSALGVTLGFEQTLGGKQLRLKGLQRDVFSFANLMGSSAVAGLALASITRKIGWRCIGWVGAALFGMMLYLSGGRSAFFGVAGAAMVAFALQAFPEQARRWMKWALLAWLTFAIFISLFGVNELSEYLSAIFFKHQRAGSTASAFMRDRAWQGVIAAIIDQPMILLSGSSVAALLDNHVAPFYHWADNEYLWLIYHEGLPGALALVLFFIGAARRASGREAADIVFLLYLFFVMGEGIARESMTFLGCLPLFVAIGFRYAPRMNVREVVRGKRREEVLV